MKDNVRTCLHPSCKTKMRYMQLCCGRHYHSIREDLLQRYKAAATPETRGAIAVEILDWFKTRMIGEHEVVRCRNKACNADIVWLTTKRGKKMPVDAGSVQPVDELFNPEFHRSHFSTCRDPDGFRRESGK